MWSRLVCGCARTCVCDPSVCAAPRNHRPCRHDATHSALVLSFSRARAAVVKNNRTGAPEFRCAPAHPPRSTCTSDRAHRQGRRDALEQRRAAARSRLTSGGRGSRPSCPPLLPTRPAMMHTALQPAISLWPNAARDAREAVNSAVRRPVAAATPCSRRDRRRLRRQRRFAPHRVDAAWPRAAELAKRGRLAAGVVEHRHARL